MADQLSAELESEIEELLTDLKTDVKAILAHAEKQAERQTATEPQNSAGNTTASPVYTAEPVADDVPNNMAPGGTAAKPGVWDRLKGMWNKNNPSWRPENMPPLWRRGLRGLGRSLYYGQSPDNPEYQLYRNMVKKEHVTLREYVEATALIDEEIDGTLVFHIAESFGVYLQNAGAAMSVDNQIDSLINKYRNRAKALFRKHIPNSPAAANAPVPTPEPSPASPAASSEPEQPPAKVRRKRKISEPAGTTPVETKPSAALSPDAAADAFLT